MLSFQIFISTISDPEIMFAFIILLALFVYRKARPRNFYIVLLSSAFAMATSSILKILLHVKRPSDMLVSVDSYRFPSGHATMAAVLASLLIYYGFTYVKNNTLRYILYVLATLWFLLVSYSRLYLHVHYPVDIIVGGLIGTSATILVIKLLKN